MTNSVADRGSFLQKVKILASSDELPDWFDADPESFFEGLVKKGFIANIQELYDELGVTDKFFKVSIDYPKFDDGSLYLVTWQGNVEYFYYNKDLFAKAGITETPKTMDELLEVCKKLKDNGIIPISQSNSGAWNLLRYAAFVPFRMTGNDFINQARLGKTSFGSEVGIKAAEFVQAIAPYYQQGWSNADDTTMVDLFKTGKTAMLYTGTWQNVDFVDENMELKKQFGYFPMPTYSEKDVTTASDYFANSGIGVAVLKESMTPEMKDYFKFLFDNYADISMYKYNALPSIKPTIKDDLPELYKNFINDLDNVNTFAHCWDVRIDSASNEVLVRETVNLAMGAITPQEWAKRMDEAVKTNAPKFFDIK